MAQYSYDTAEDKGIFMIRDKFCRAVAIGQEVITML